jgi:hypothetical protein
MEQPMSRITLPEERLPTDSETLINDAALSALTGIHQRSLSVYRRAGFLPPFDRVLGLQGQGGWRWSTMAEFVQLVRASDYLRQTGSGVFTRVGILRPLVAKVWPERADVPITTPYAKRKAAERVAA